MRSGGVVDLFYFPLQVLQACPNLRFPLHFVNIIMVFTKTDTQRTIKYGGNNHE